MAKDEHQAADVNQQENPFEPDGPGQSGINPLAGSEFKSGSKKHHGKPDQKERTEGLPDHLRGGDSRLHSFGCRKFLPDEHGAIDSGWDQDGGETNLPAKSGRPQQVGKNAADHDSAGPPRVEHVQLVGFVLRIERGRQRVDDGFHQTVTQPSHEPA